MKIQKLLNIGVAGALIAALCCFTPILVVLLAVAGLSAITGYIDYVLYPILGIFILIIVYAVWKKSKL